MSTNRILVSIGAASLALALGGCGSGNGDNNTAAPAGTPPTQPPITGLQPTLASIQDNVFTPICTRCHTGSNAPQGLALDAGVSAGNLINVAVPRDPSQVRVLPGDPDHSFLIHKLEGTQSIGQRMPLGGPFLDQTSIDDIRQWITNGAPTT